MDQNKAGIKQLSSLLSEDEDLIVLDVQNVCLVMPLIYDWDKLILCTIRTIGPLELLIQKFISIYKSMITYQNEWKDTVAWVGVTLEVNYNLEEFTFRKPSKTKNNLIFF